MNELKQAIQQLAGTHLNDEVSLIACSVDSVDISARKCNCVAISGNGITELPNVQLMADVDDGFLLVPAEGSTVIVSFSKRNEPYVAMFSAIDKVLMTANNFQFNDGSYGGLTRTDVLTEKINNLENLLNDLIEKYNTHTHPGVSSGSSTSAPTVLQEDQTITPTVRQEIENTTVIHGV